MWGIHISIHKHLHSVSAQDFTALYRQIWKMEFFTIYIQYQTATLSYQQELKWLLKLSNLSNPYRWVTLNQNVLSKRNQREICETKVCYRKLITEHLAFHSILKEWMPISNKASKNAMGYSGKFSVVMICRCLCMCCYEGGTVNLGKNYTPMTHTKEQITSTIAYHVQSW